MRHELQARRCRGPWTGALIAALLAGLLGSCGTGLPRFGKAKRDGDPGGGNMGRFRLLNFEKAKKVEDIKIEREVKDPEDPQKFIWEDITSHLTNWDWTAVSPYGMPTNEEQWYGGNVSPWLDAAYGVRVSFRLTGEAALGTPLTIDHTTLGGITRQVRTVILVVNDGGAGQLYITMWDTVGGTNPAVFRTP